MMYAQNRYLKGSLSIVIRLSSLLTLAACTFNLTPLPTDISIKTVTDLPPTKIPTLTPTQPPTAVPTSLPTATSTATHPPTGFKEATYLIEGQPVILVNGISEIEAAPGSTLKITTIYFGNEATGDLNGDGLEDIAFLLTQNMGGTGIFFYVVAALRTDTGYQGTNAILLGDRIAPQTTQIENGVIVVNYADRSLDESFDVPPSVGVSKYLRVIDAMLVVIDAP